MNNKTLRRWKRKWKRTLYHALLALSEITVPKKVLWVGFTVILLVIGCFLPTHTKTQTLSLSAACTEHSADVFALYLPETSGSQELYSIYLTGTELRFFAEGAVSFSSGDLPAFLFGGLTYTYYPLRLPLNRITSLQLSDGSALAPEELYHVVGSAEMFSLFETISYRSQGLIRIQPKTADGMLLSLAEPLSPLLQSKRTDAASVSLTASVHRITGFNLVALLRAPNRITLYIAALFAAFCVLLLYCIPRIRRVRVWLRIHAIRLRKRASHTYGLHGGRRTAGQSGRRAA